MEHSKAIGKANVIAIALGALGTLFFIAMALNLVPSNIAIFAAIACFIIAGAIRRMMMPGV